MSERQKSFEGYKMQMVMVAKGFTAMMQQDQYMEPDEISAYIKTMSSIQSMYEYYKELLEEENNAQ